MGNTVENSGCSLKTTAGQKETGGPEVEPARMAAVIAAPLRAEVPLSAEDCRICYSRFDAERRPPRQLDCLHTFCLDCLRQMHQAQRRGGSSSSSSSSDDSSAAALTCPLCRHQTALPDGSVYSPPVTPKLAPSTFPPPQNYLQRVVQVAESAQQRPLPDQAGGERTAVSPPALTATSTEAESGSDCGRGCCNDERLSRLSQKMPWVWVAFCLLSALLLSIAFTSPILWNLSPWVPFLAVSFCCALSCCLIVWYTEIRRYRRESSPCPPCLMLPFPGSCL